jgi:hypothetical protein
MIIETLKERVTLLHCTIEYPAPFIIDCEVRRHVECHAGRAVTLRAGKIRRGRRIT